MDLESILKEIEPTSFNIGQLRSTSREADFFRLAFDLTRETGQWATLLASVNFSNKPDWNLEQAIIGGHLVRLSKLTRSLLENINQRREELIWVVLRLCAECVINLRFLLVNANAKTFRSYLLHSLQYDAELLKKIDENIANRGGMEQPIEKRMRRSILRAFEKSQMRLESVPKKRIQNWADMNLFEKAKSVGLEKAYFAIIGGPSRNVHGGWRDLLEHHLQVTPAGAFRPKIDFSELVRPQPLFAYSSIILEALIGYVGFVGSGELNELIPRLRTLRGKVLVADRLHERYLQRTRP